MEFRSLARGVSAGLPAFARLACGRCAGPLLTAEIPQEARGRGLGALEELTGRKDLREVETGLKYYELKVRGVLGGEAGDQQEIVILNRRLLWVADTMTYEADPMHVDSILKGWG